VAEGGFGVVYHAIQTALERPVALKILKPPGRLDEASMQQFLAGFEAEAKTIARISHPNIVHVYDYGVSVMPSGARAAWMALEWLTGSTLEQELRARRGKGGRSTGECLALLKPVLSAIALLHEQGVAHRDIKPANLMLVSSENEPTLKLLDFGIAKIMESGETPGSGHTQTRSKEVSFSPAYAAPEQISSGRSGPWTDVHALGLILTEMLTDRAPYGQDAALRFSQIVDRVRPTPGSRGVDVGAWETVLRRALAVSPADRYRDAGELTRALEGAPLAVPTARVSIPVAVSGDFQKGSSSADTINAAATLASLGAAAAPEPPATTSAPTYGGAPSDPRKERTGPNGRGARVGIYVAAGAAVLVAAGLGWSALTARSSNRPAIAMEARPDASVTPSASAPAPSESTSPTNSSQPGESNAEASASPSPPARTPTRPATPAARKPDCSVPYTLDAAGNKHWKVECVSPSD